MNTEYGKSRYIKYSHGTTEARQHGTHTVWPNSKRRFFSLFNSAKNHNTFVYPIFKELSDVTEMMNH